MLLIGLFFGGGIGFLTAAANGVTLDGHDHAAHGGAQAHEHGAPIAVPEGSVTLDAKLTPDALAGWNLEIIVTGMAFSPQNASGLHVPGEGHAHVYVDGIKVARVYGPWVHLDHVGKEVRVSLNANDHSPLEMGGAALDLTIPVP